jgi:hypothetical protein
VLIRRLALRISSRAQGGFGGSRSHKPGSGPVLFGTRLSFCLENSGVVLGGLAFENRKSAWLAAWSSTDTRAESRPVFSATRATLEAVRHIERGKRDTGFVALWPGVSYARPGGERSHHAVDESSKAAFEVNRKLEGAGRF